MIIISANIESTAREFDSFLIDVSDSVCAANQEIEKVEIKPESDFITIFDKEVDDLNEMSLPYMFERTGTYPIEIKITSGSEVKNHTVSIEIVEAVNDIHFSNDSDLITHENRIKNFLGKGKISFINLHRIVKTEILTQLKKINNKITFESILNKDEIKAWSKFRTLELIFESNISQLDDIHTQKRDTYQELVKTSINQAKLSIDVDLDGLEDTEVTTHPITLVLS